MSLLHRITEALQAAARRRRLRSALDAVTAEDGVLTEPEIDQGAVSRWVHRKAEESAIPVGIVGDDNAASRTPRRTTGSNPVAGSIGLGRNPMRS